MSWIREGPPTYNFLDRLGLWLLKCGSIPNHVAFIMDGNRRFARQNQMENIQGHSLGFDKMAETLQWCRDLGIKEVTVYAFSIENFKRSPSEVEGLLDLAREKFKRIVAEKDRLAEHGVRVRVIGNSSLLPQDLQDLIRQTEEITKDNNERILNVAFSYTSREEMTQAVRVLATAVNEEKLEPSEITGNILESCLYTNGSPFSSKVDLLIRTSGEVRLSDFMLWQSSHAVIYFTDVLWPDFTFQTLLLGIFYYQRNKREVESILQICQEHVSPDETAMAVQNDFKSRPKKIDINAVKA